MLGIFMFIHATVYFKLNKEKLTIRWFEVSAILKNIKELFSLQKNFLFFQERNSNKGR